MMWGRDTRLIEIGERQKGHEWRRGEDGDIDHWVLDVDHHNGPGCRLCHYSFCEHCTRVEDIEPCDVVTIDTTAVEIKGGLPAPEGEG
jgi:hypothetical protein